MTRRNLEVQKSIYSEKVKKVVGVFGVLLICNAFTWLPYFSAGLIGLVIGLERLPPEFLATVFVIFLLSNVTNSVIQAYFRRELADTMKGWVRRVLCSATRSPSSNNGIGVVATSNSHVISQSHAHLGGVAETTTPIHHHPGRRTLNGHIIMTSQSYTHHHCGGGAETTPPVGRTLDGDAGMDKVSNGTSTDQEEAVVVVVDATVNIP